MSELEVNFTIDGLKIKAKGETILQQPFVMGYTYPTLLSSTPAHRFMSVMSGGNEESRLITPRNQPRRYGSIHNQS